MCNDPARMSANKGMDLMPQVNINVADKGVMGEKHKEKQKMSWNQSRGVFTDYRLEVGLFMLS